MKHKKPNLNDLEAFLTDESQSKADTVKDLRSMGVDTKTLFARVESIVQQSYSEQLRLIAEREQAERRNVPGFLMNLANMTRDNMLALFEQVSDGSFGPEYKSAALARCRNKDASALTDEELRSWLEDIGSVLGEPNE